MKKNKQEELIKKIIDSPKPNQDTKEFKKLQMHWYNKLEDKTDFNDIERTGTMRHKYYDEYGGLIKHYSWLLTQKYDFSAHQHYQRLRKISWNGIVTSNSCVFDASKPFKTHKLDLSSLKSAQKAPPHDNNKAQKLKSDSNNPPDITLPTEQTIKTQKLSKVDSRILYMLGDGEGFREISSYLRRYLSHHASRRRTGPKGKPFSVYWVHTRAEKLLEDIKAGHILEAVEAGGVRKRLLSLNSYIYTENNNEEGGEEKP